MGGQRFKVGDWVRRVQPSDWPEQYGVVDRIYKVLEVSKHGHIVVIAGSTAAMHGAFEPWQPRVGERVRFTDKVPSFWFFGPAKEYKDGVIKSLNSEGYRFCVKTGGAVGHVNIEHIEPITTATSPEQPATLKIEAGKFYKTRDGRKVGPAFIVGSCAVFGNGSNYASAVWADDGRSSHRDDKLSLKDNDIIAEWIDEPVAKASNDNAQPRFKVGDRVVLTADNPESPSFGVKGAIGKIGSIEGKSARVAFETGPHAGDFWYVPISVLAAYYTPAVKNTTAIVALIESGQPKPSSTPHVHASTGAAEKEAKRLAAKYKGKRFGVFTLTATHEEAAPVYDHKWQNMAAIGLKIDAIKELRAVAGLTLKGAKDAVEAWIEYENAA